MRYSFAFEKLEAWQKSKKLAVTLYKLTDNFPAEEKFGIVSQMRRAAISVSSNLAEGTSRASLKDQNRFTEIAYVP